MTTAIEIIRVARHRAANSFGHVIGEHEELVETLTDAGFPAYAKKVDAIFDQLGGRNHKEIRACYIKLLTKVIGDK